MTTTALADELLAVATAVPGVTGVFPTVLAPRAILDTAVALVTQRTPDVVVVEEREDGVEVALRIGVGHEFSAAATCRAVHDALRAHLATGSRTWATARISVTVAQVG